MAIDSDPSSGLEAAAVADIKMLVAKRLREEYLQHFTRTRDELLHVKRPDDSETVRLLRRRQLHTLKEAWDGVLQALRSELPGALDQLLSSLEPEFEERPLSIRALDTAPPSPATMVLDDVPLTSPRAENLARSDTSFAPTSTPKTIVVKADGKTSSDTTKEKMGSVTSNETPKKRSSDNLNEQLTTPPSKRAKRGSQPLDQDIDYRIPIRRMMFLNEVQEDECLFKYPGYAGVYILRCNVNRCRKRLGVDGPIVFTWHPFGDGSSSSSSPPAAMGHFEGEGHGISDEGEVFRKYAIRILDADTERNTQKKAVSGPDNSNQSPEKPAVLPPTTSPNKKKENTKDKKGKKPEKPFSSTLLSASVSAQKNVTEEAFHRTGGAPLADGSDDDGVEELLPPINRFHAPRGL